MTTRRQKTQDFILKHLKMIDPNGDNVSRYEKMFEGMSDDAFDTWMHELKNKQEQIFMYIPNMTANLDMDRLLAVSDSLGMDLFERIWMYDDATKTKYLTPKKYLVLQLPIRRVKQYQDHKLTVSEGDSRLDLLTGQVVKPDAAAGISLVEAQTLMSRGLPYLLAEYLKYRGGDIHAYAELKQSLEETGVGQVSLESTGTMARSPKMLDILLRSMHIHTNIVHPDNPKE